jgi:hypothetical protein
MPSLSEGGPSQSQRQPAHIITQGCLTARGNVHMHDHFAGKDMMSV